MVTRRNLDKEAKGLGFEVKIKKRGEHDAYIKGSITIPVPKKREIKEILATEIRKQFKGKGQR